MSRVSEAMAAIDEALRLGNITKEVAIKLKNCSFKNSAEFNELYNITMSLNNDNCNKDSLEKFSRKFSRKNFWKIFLKNL